MILVLGEVLVDLVADPADPRRLTAHPGGGPANTAVALARLGTPVGFAGRLATGGFGPMLREHLRDNGVDLRAAVPAAEPATLALVQVDGAGGARYEFYTEGTADWQWSAAELSDQPAAGVTAIHTGSLAIAQAPGSAVIAALLGRAAGAVTVSLDPNVRPALIGDRDVYRSDLERWVGRSDLVRVSAEDLAWVYPRRGWAEVAAEWLRLGPWLVVVTRGGDGVYALTADVTVERAAVPVTVVDTVGAGDSFTAGLLDRLHRGGRLGPGRLAGLTAAELSAALDFAARVAAVTCGRAGADPPTRAELESG